MNKKKGPDERTIEKRDNNVPWGWACAGGACRYYR